MNALSSRRRFIFFALLVGVTLFIGAATLDQYRRYTKQAKITIGDTFPELTFHRAAETTTPNEKQIILFARNGCVHCKHLEENFSAVYESLNKPASWRERILVVSLDAPSETAPEAWATTATYDSDANDLYFNSTPQLYFLDEKKQVVRKFIGAVPKEKLEKEISAFLKNQ